MKERQSGREERQGQRKEARERGGEIKESSNFAPECFGAMAISCAVIIFAYG